MDSVLITGSGGMVGSHLYERCHREGVEVIGAFFKPTVDLRDVARSREMIEMDVRYRGEVEAVIRKYRPQTIYHLAAQSLPVRSWKAPEETLEVNILGTVNLFESIRAVRAESPDYDPIVVVACSSAEYGASLTPENVPITESAQLLPLHSYGVSKVAQDLLTFQYWMNYKIRGIRARIFNSTGPRKVDDVVSDFARGVARICRDDDGVLRVGNLETRRAILSVNDLVEALVLLTRKGDPGEAYNICSNNLYRIGDLVTMFEVAAGRPIRVETAPELLRPSDEPVIFGDTTKLRNATGWREALTLQDTIQSVLDYELGRLAGTAS